MDIFGRSQKCPCPNHMGFKKQGEKVEAKGLVERKKEKRLVAGNKQKNVNYCLMR